MPGREAASPNLDPGLVQSVLGFKELLRALHLPEAAAVALLDDLLQLGAVAVAELEISDWESLKALALLRPLQRRRLLQFITTM